MVRSWFGEFKNLGSLTTAGMLTALAVALKLFAVFRAPVAGTLVQFEPHVIIIALCGMLFGPVMGGIVGLLSDIVTIPFTVNPIPHFAVNYFLIGFIFGLIVYKKVTVERILIAQTVNTLVVTFFLTGLWFKVVYMQETSVIITGRLVKCAIAFPAELWLLIILAKSLVVIYNKNFRKR